MHLTRLAWKRGQELFKMRTSGQLDAISSISPPKKKLHQSISNSFCFFWQNSSPIRTISDLVIETGGARPALRHARSLVAQLAVDGSTDLSAHRFRSSLVRNVAIDQLLPSIATVEVESVGWHMVTRFSSASTYFYLHISIHHYTSFNSMDKDWKILRVSSWTCFIHLKGPCIPCTTTIVDNHQLSESKPLILHSKCQHAARLVRRLLWPSIAKRWILFAMCLHKFWFMQHIIVLIDISGRWLDSWLIYSPKNTLNTFKVLARHFQVYNYTLQCSH